MQTYADVYRRMQTYADVRRRMRTSADVSEGMQVLTYACRFFQGTHFYPERHRFIRSATALPLWPSVPSTILLRRPGLLLTLTSVISLAPLRL